MTVHGTIAHELAYHKIPVINAGDNPHINYSFSLHPKNLDEYFYLLKNIKICRKKINFTKKPIYEFIYMHYHHFLFRFQKKNLLLDQYFTNQTLDKNGKSYKKLKDETIFDFYIKNSKFSDRNIRKYISNFINSEII